MPALAMRKHNGPGILITFCGLDGCGKTTMIRHLSQWMEEKGYCLFLTRQPTDFVRQSQAANMPGTLVRQSSAATI